MLIFAVALFLILNIRFTTLYRRFSELVRDRHIQQVRQYVYPIVGTDVLLSADESRLELKE
ncbi:MAG: hypothetical protein U9P81_04415 [Euryarchaeota archaeon]|nr:hypothetical protein [Euryarchaeota archaeon]